MIEYTSEIGWHGILDEYGVTVYDEKGNRKMSSSSPAGHTAEWLKELKRFREQTRWIPVSERLPEKTGRYLCTVGAEYRNPREMYYAPQEWANKSDAATWRSIDGSYVYDWFVKAWMPLPEPYKAESEDKE